MNITEILKSAADKSASDIFLIPGTVLEFKIYGALVGQGTEEFTAASTEALVREVYKLAGDRDITRLIELGDDDFSFHIPGVARFRISSFKQRGSLAAVIRIVRFKLPDYRELHIPDFVMELAENKKGFILVTGSAGSGKSTTLSCIIDRINHTRSAHIITLEDPIEYLHRHDQSIVTQREIGLDSQDYISALRAALRQAPDVILIGEMRDQETIRAAITAAETGHLVLSTLHTTGAANTIDRIIDSFKPEQQQQVRIQLSLQMTAIISQTLVPTIEGSLIPAFEIMKANTAVRNMIREAKTPQISALLRSTAEKGMLSLDDSLIALYQKGIITEKVCLGYSLDPDNTQKKLTARPAAFR